MRQGNVYKWSFIDRVSIALINFGVSIAFARMLTTADFGLLAMIAIFIAVASDLSSCGLSDGLIHKTRPTELDYSTVFVFNSAVGLLFGLLFFFGAPLVASFFNHEELCGIMRVLGVSFFLQSMSYVQETKMRKELRMKTICFVRVGATITVSAMGIVAAALGYGYWALVCTQILLSAFFFIYYSIASRWFPKIQFSVKSFKEMFFYGVHLMLSYMATLIGKNVNTFVLGRFCASSSMSGIYYQGAKLASVPFGVTESTFNSPFFVVASNEEDVERQRLLLNNMLNVIIGVNGLLMMLMLVVAAPGIEMLYGEKWLKSIPIFRILALAEFLFCARAYLQTVCKVHARTVFVRNMAFAEVAFQLLLLAIFYRFGLIWIAWTQALGVLGSTIVYLFYCRRRLLGLGWGELLGIIFGALWLPGLAALVAALVLWLLPVSVGVSPSWLWPFAKCVVVAVVYGAVVMAVGELAHVRSYIALRDRLLKKKPEGAA